MENEPHNLTIGTLIRVAHASDSRVEFKLARKKGTKKGRRRNGGGRVKTRSFNPKVAAPGKEVTIQ